MIQRMAICLLLSFFFNLIRLSPCYADTEISCKKIFLFQHGASKNTILSQFSILKNQLEQIHSEYSFFLEVKDGVISKDFLSPVLDAYHLEIFATQKNRNNNIKPFISFSLARINNKTILLENLKTHSLLEQGNQEFLFGVGNQKSHKGISFKEFSVAKNWLIDYLKDHGYSTILSSGQQSYSVSRFYRYLGMKPKNESYVRLESYLSLVLKECKKIGCGSIHTVEELSSSLSIYHVPTVFINPLESFFRSSFSVNDVVSLETVLKKESLALNILVKEVVLNKDSRGQVMAVTISYDNFTRTFFKTPDTLASEVSSSILSWDGINNLVKELTLDLI